MLFSLIASHASTFRQRDQSGEGDRAAGHVDMHVEHGAVCLEVDAAGVEQDALAHQRDVGRGGRAAGARFAAAPAQPGDAGGACGVAARHGQKGAGAQALQSRLRIPGEAQAMAA
jgi:hypothetical protein